MREKEYVLDHNWGSYNTPESINKLALRNEDDALDYFKTILIPLFNMIEIDEDIFKFEDGSVFQITLSVK